MLICEKQIWLRLPRNTLACLIIARERILVNARATIAADFILAFLRANRGAI